jgi:TldD protein
VGITCYVEGVSGYSFTSSTSTEDARAATRKAFTIAKASSLIAKLKLPFSKAEAVKSRRFDTISVAVHPRDRDLAFKTELVNRVVGAAREHGASIRNVRGMYGELYGKKLLTNSDGSQIDWDYLVADLICFVTSRTDAGAMVVGVEMHGGSFGLEEYEKKGTTPEDMGKEAGSRAKEQLNSQACPAGKFRALAENTLVGVLAHESFGHLSEADFVVTGASPLTGKIGTHLGSSYASIVDEGLPNIKNSGGLWLPFDDEGIRTGLTKVLDKGVLAHYLHNRGTAEKLEQKPTGNSRAVDFMCPPIVRMTNTYFLPGDLTEEEAMEQLGTGIYALQSLGGQVSEDGNFLFMAPRGYWIEKGEIKHPLRGVTLSGNILELLSHVEGATKDLQILSGYFGGCGKGGQFHLPVGLGGPKLVIDEVTFGGQA